MRNLFTISVLLLSGLGVFAQTSITSQSNALLTSDNYTSREIQFVEPGNGGANQIWDFSKIIYTDKNPVSDIQSKTTQTLPGVSNYNVVLNEAGYNFFLNKTETSLEELGYINTEKNMTLTYSDPVLKMKYPFNYGESFSDPYTGVAYFNKDYRIDFSGKNSVNADATGTLILPEQVLNNVLRVKTVKTGVQVNPCGSVKIFITKYAWYAPGYRYPVMVLTVVDNKFSNGKTEFNTAASVNLQQTVTPLVNATSGNFGSVKPTEKSDVKVMVYPNPFSDKISYNYFLRSQIPVSITLYDLAGKYSEQVVNNEVQSQGVHSGNLDKLTAKLPAGVYYLRFVFDNQVVVSKVVKLENQ